jgi:hypothetical protein
MSRCKLNSLLVALIVPVTLAACGLYTPDKDPFTSDKPISHNSLETKQGLYEDGVVDHVVCEITQGLIAAQKLQKFQSFVSNWGTTVSLTLTVEDQTGLAPGISTINPLQNVIFPFPAGGNVVSPQSFSLNIGGTASVNALRTETIQFTVRNQDLIRYPCDIKRTGILIDGNLKIAEFIYDKAFVINQGNGLWRGDYIPYNTWSEEITFVSAYGGTATPTWKLARLSANTSSNLFTAERTNTNDLIITLGPLDPCQQDPRLIKQKRCPPGTETFPLQLIASAMNQHNARVQAAAIAVSITGQTH